MKLLRKLVRILSSIKKYLQVILKHLIYYSFIENHIDGGEDSSSRTFEPRNEEDNSPVLEDKEFIDGSGNLENDDGSAELDEVDELVRGEQVQKKKDFGDSSASNKREENEENYEKLNKRATRYGQLKGPYKSFKHLVRFGSRRHFPHWRPMIRIHPNTRRFGYIHSRKYSTRALNADTENDFNKHNYNDDDEESNRKKRAIRFGQLSRYGSVKGLERFGKKSFPTKHRYSNVEDKLEEDEKDMQNDEKSNNYDEEDYDYDYYDDYEEESDRKKRSTRFGQLSGYGSVKGLKRFGKKPFPTKHRYSNDEDKLEEDEKDMQNDEESINYDEEDYDYDYYDDYEEESDRKKRSARFGQLSRYGSVKGLKRFGKKTFPTKHRYSNDEDKLEEDEKDMQSDEESNNYDEEDYDYDYYEDYEEESDRKKRSTRFGQLSGYGSVKGLKRFGKKTFPTKHRYSNDEDKLEEDEKDMQNDKESINYDEEDYDNDYYDDYEEESDRKKRSTRFGQLSGYGSVKGLRRFGKKPFPTKHRYSNDEDKLEEDEKDMQNYEESNDEEDYDYDYYDDYEEESDRKKRSTRFGQLSGYGSVKGLKRFGKKPFPTKNRYSNDEDKLEEDEKDMQSDEESNNYDVEDYDYDYYDDYEEESDRKKRSTRFGQIHGYNSARGLRRFGNRPFPSKYRNFNNDEDELDEDDEKNVEDEIEGEDDIHDEDSNSYEYEDMDYYDDLSRKKRATQYGNGPSQRHFGKFTDNELEKDEEDVQGDYENEDYEDNDDEAENYYRKKRSAELISEKKDENSMVDFIRSYQHITKNPIDVEKLMSGQKRGQKWVKRQTEEMKKTRDLILNLKKTRYNGLHSPANIVRSIKNAKHDVSSKFINDYLYHYYSGGDVLSALQ